MPTNPRMPYLLDQAELSTHFQNIKNRQPGALLTDLVTVAETGEIAQAVLSGSTYYVCGPEYSIPLMPTAAHNQPFTVTELGAFTAPLPASFAALLTKFVCFTNADTLLAATKYWTTALKYVKSGGSVTTLCSFDNDTDTSATETKHTITTFSGNPTTAGDYRLSIDCTKVSTPDGLTIFPVVYVRNIYATLT